MAVDVSIAMVAYNALDKLRVCLDSIAAQTTDRTVETILVDNDSTEPVAETVARDYPWVTLIPSRENLGFAAGTNRAIEASSGRIVWWLNPDTVLPCPTTLDALVDRLETGDADILGCRLELPDGNPQRLRRCLPTVGRAILDLAHLPVPAEPVTVEFVTGACLLTRAETQAAVGLLDDGYFMYFEDVDWCRRARDLGYRFDVADDITVIHHEGATFGGKMFVRREHYTRGLLRYIREHDGRLAAAALRLALVGLTGPKLLLSPLDRSPERAARRELLRAQWRLGWRGC